MISQDDLRFLRRCLQLAKTALEAGDSPFGSVLVAGDGKILFEDHNRDSGGDPTQHPEFAIARWAAQHLGAQERAAATVYTSGEHCPMCAAAHAYVGLGRIVYASSSRQLAEWRRQFGVAAGAVRPLAINDVAPGLSVTGPSEELAQEVQQLQRRYHTNRA
jgi:tRNA(Arg) A34 adenosine deaminase TadA